MREILAADGADPKLRAAAKFYLDRDAEAVREDNVLKLEVAELKSKYCPFFVVFFLLFLLILKLLTFLLCMPRLSTIPAYNLALGF